MAVFQHLFDELTNDLIPMPVDEIAYIHLSSLFS